MTALLLLLLSLPGVALADAASFLAVEGPVADGFDLPQDSGGLTVRTAAAGVVVRAGFDEPGRGAVEIEHTWYDSTGKHRTRSTYGGLERVDVAAGESLSRRQAVGAMPSDAARHRLLQFQLSDSAEPRAFIQAHGSTFVPADEPVLLLLDPASDSLTWVERGEAKATYSVAWGQLPGAKREEGDLRTPRGLYFVVSKARGEFGGTYGAYYGGHWIKVNYPGPHDAVRGLAEGWIDEATATKINERWAARKLTPQTTRLGSGIGLHGWAAEWDDAESRGKSFGCVVLHNRDIAALYDRIPEGTAVMILSGD